ncbi:hypothetical protein AAF712_015690 [Marasmius tenuissimus]|uniref:Uncharacterized protein n=1 Tax=Marasmius tenuissimus TaxID=585030 RepID=A0ABR2Z7J8_9AGAR
MTSDPSPADSQHLRRLGLPGAFPGESDVGSTENLSDNSTTSNYYSLDSESSAFVAGDLGHFTNTRSTKQLLDTQIEAPEPEYEHQQMREHDCTLQLIEQFKEELDDRTQQVSCLQDHLHELREQLSVSERLRALHAETTETLKASACPCLDPSHEEIEVLKQGQRALGCTLEEVRRELLKAENARRTVESAAKSGILAIRSEIMVFGEEIKQMLLHPQPL